MPRTRKRPTLQIPDIRGLPVVPADGWRARSLCARNILPFDLSIENPSSIVYTEAARAICHRCVVREDCLSYALSNPDDISVLGGHTPDERKAVQPLWKAYVQEIRARQQEQREKLASGALFEAELSLPEAV